MATGKTDDKTKKPDGADDGNADDGNGSDDLDERIGRVFDQRFNSAMTERNKRLEEKLTKSFADTLAKTLDEKLKTPPPDAGKGADDAANKGAAKGNPELIALNERLEKLQRKTDEAEARAKAVEEQARREKAETTLRAELVEKHGVRPEHAEALVDRWVSRGVVKFNDDGEPVMVVKRARSKGARAEEAEFSLPDGLTDWAKGDDAKSWLPAAGAQTGNTRQGRSAPGSRQTGASSGGSQAQGGASALNSISEHDVYGD